jgi:hypothetical protein
MIYKIRLFISNIIYKIGDIVHPETTKLQKKVDNLKGQINTYTMELGKTRISVAKATTTFNPSKRPPEPT